MPPGKHPGPLNTTTGDPSRPPLPSLLRKEITWLFRKRHPKWEIRWHVLIAEWKWSLSVSNQFCSAGNRSCVPLSYKSIRPHDAHAEYLSFSAMVIPFESVRVLCYPTC